MTYVGSEIIDKDYMAGDKDPVGEPPDSGSVLKTGLNKQSVFKLV